MVSKHSIHYLLSLMCTFTCYKSEQASEKSDSNSTELKDDDFEKTVKSSAYIDKTLFIRDLLDLPQYYVITGPRGFSKTTNLNMLKSFFEHELDESHNLKDPKFSKKLHSFKDKKVFTDVKFFWQHFAKYPVIHIDQSLEATQDFDQFLKSFVKHCIDPLVVKFDYLLNSTKLTAISTKDRSRYVKGYQWTKEELQNFGADLASLLYQHHGTKPILLIDEYDAPSLSALLDDGVSEEDTKDIMRFIGAFVGKMVILNDTFRAVLTGCLAIKLEYGYFGGAPIPNLQYQPIFESKKLYSAYGFLETDLDELQKRFAISPNEMETHRSYYKGYSVHDKSEGTAVVKPSKTSTLMIYNSRSILYSLRRRAIGEYWPGGFINKLRPLLRAEKWGPVLEECMMKRCKIPLIYTMEMTDLLHLKKSLLSAENVDGGSFLFQVLLETGYFTVEEKQESSCVIGVPNCEVQTVMMDEFYNGPYLYDRYGFTKEDERNYLTSLNWLSSNVTSLHNLVKSVRTLFRNLAPKDEVFMQVVLLHPLLNCTEFSTLPVEKDKIPPSSYVVFTQRWRDLAGIMFEMKTGPLGLKSLAQDTNRTLIDAFKQFPEMRDTVDLRLVVSANSEVYGFYNYKIFNGNSTCEFWPPRKTNNRVDNKIIN